MRIAQKYSKVPEKAPAAPTRRKTAYLQAFFADAFVSIAARVLLNTDRRWMGTVGSFPRGLGFVSGWLQRPR
jgi:hypothetical protein